MFIDKDSIIIDNVSFGQYLVDVKYMYPKLWGKDTGRNLAGTNSGTFIGVFPKLVLQFRKLTREELEIIAPILDRPWQTLTYYDPNLQRDYTMVTNSGDWEVVNKHLINGNAKNEGFSISFIAKKKR